MRDTPGRIKPQILIADDESINLQIAQEMLQSWGILVDTAANGLQVIGLIRKKNYDAVIMDIEMPVMDGLKTTRILRTDTRYRTLPIIASTALSSPEEKENLLQQGFSSVLSKPLMPETLYKELALFVFLEPCVSDLDHSDPGPTQDQDEIQPTAEKKMETIARPIVSSEDEISTLPSVTESRLLLAEIARLPGFDCHKGLNRVMGNLNLYSKLLLDFKSILKKSHEEIRDSRIGGDIQNLQAVIHKIKGVSGNIGAEELYAQVVQVEPLLRKKDLQAAEGLLDSLETTLQNNLDTLGRLEMFHIQTDSGQPPKPPVLSRSPVSSTLDSPKREKIQESLEATLELLRQCNTASREAFANLRQLIGDVYASEQEATEISINMFDFDNAEKNLLKLSRCLGLTMGTSHDFQ